MFSTYGKLQLSFSTIPMLKITEFGFCLAFAWLLPGFCHWAGAVSIVTGLIVLIPTMKFGTQVGLQIARFGAQKPEILFGMHTGLQVCMQQQSPSWTFSQKFKSQRATNPAICDPKKSKTLFSMTKTRGSQESSLRHDSHGISIYWCGCLQHVFLLTQKLFVDLKTWLMRENIFF